MQKIKDAIEKIFKFIQKILATIFFIICIPLIILIWVMKGFIAWAECLVEFWGEKENAKNRETAN